MGYAIFSLDNSIDWVVFRNFAGLFVFLMPGNDNETRIAACLIQCYAPTHDVAPRAVSIADAIDAIS